MTKATENQRRIVIVDAYVCCNRLSTCIIIPNILLVFQQQQQQLFQKFNCKLNSNEQ